MAASIPPSLKSGDISRFAVRGAQVERAKPVISYWCYYAALQAIIQKGLHLESPDNQSYALSLMEKVEQMKSSNLSNDAVTDDLAAQAYVEEFGLETFLRAANAMKANKVTKQTADTFQASATFLDILHTWGPLDPEIAVKIKFAKYHALRIAKALKNGEDPNLSNPAPEPEEEEENIFPSIEGTNGLQSPTVPHVSEPSATVGDFRQPSVEDAPDAEEQNQPSLALRSTRDESLHPSRAPDAEEQNQPSLALRSTRDESLHPSRAPSVPPEITPPRDPYIKQEPDVSPLESKHGDSAADNHEYFPNVPIDPDPNDGHNVNVSNEGDEPSDIALPSPPSLPHTGDPYQQPFSADTLFSDPKSPPFNPIGSPPIVPPPSQVPPFQKSAGPPPVVPNFAVPLPIIPRPTRTAAAPRSLAPINYTADEEAIAKAQKHARWAISALNFEDVNTAVKELQNALQTLGAA
ncbi:hypothetical protein MMC25_004822 [Agyrium rufum]|nr:hypothetical protein [Agyrium rufum]